MAGKLKETQLKVLPSLLTDWTNWKTLHPVTTVAVMSRTSTDYTTRFYESDSATMPSRFLAGLRNAESSKAWPVSYLNTNSLLNESWNGKPVVINFDPTTYTVSVFARELDNKNLTFKTNSDGTFADQATNSTWDLQLGIATSGPLAGKSLQQFPAGVSFSEAWLEQFPETELFQPPAIEKPKSKNWTALIGILVVGFCIALALIVRKRSH